MNGMAKAFSLIELLVVLGIIVILLGVLAPALDQATHAAEVVFCASNEHAVGQSLGHWLMEHHQTYPAIRNYGTLMGNIGSSTQFGSNLWSARQRPLNAYLGYSAEAVRVAECPADAGDSLSYETLDWTPTPKAYNGYGSSYIEAYSTSKWGVRAVFGQINDPDRPSLRSTQIKRSYNKILLGDWPFYGDRRFDSERTRWHREDERQLNILFADFHVDFFLFPNREMENPSNSGRNPDPSFYWW